MKKHKIYLYHATFEANKESILKNGLQLPNGKENFKGMYAGEYIYLAQTPEQAASFAELAENVPEKWLDKIIVFKVEVDMEDLDLDPNNKDDNETGMTFICPYHIKPEALTLLKTY